MNYVDFSAGNKEYKLRLNTRNVIALEKQIGCNPLAIFGDGDTVPTEYVMVLILHAALQQYNHGITVEGVYDIFDSWIMDGHCAVDFVKVILEIYKVSGIYPKEVASQEEVSDYEKN